MKTITLSIPVVFSGVVEIKVPTTVPASRRKALAEKLAVARVLATTDNPDAPEDDACNEYANDFDLPEGKAGREWDGCTVEGVGGGWSVR